jgi:hypothetical protein
VNPEEKTMSYFQMTEVLTDTPMMDLGIPMGVIL